MKYRYFLLLTLLALQGCGSFTPFPSHGGGKRFAIEQTLLSAASKKAISDFPVEDLRGKKVFVDITVIFDEGGGALNGGRPYASETLRAAITRERTTDGGRNTQSGGLGLSSFRGDNAFTKDLSLNSSDSRHLTNLFSSFLLRNNVLRNPVPEVDGEADYLVEIIVDVFGTIWKRTDWGLNNSDSLKAVISYEYAITPLKEELKGKSKIGYVAYEAFFKENYLVWMGPTNTQMIVQKSDLAKFVGTLGEMASEGTTNIRKDNPRDFLPPSSPAPVQINPGIR